MSYYPLTLFWLNSTNDICYSVQGFFPAGSPCLYPRLEPSPFAFDTHTVKVTLSDKCPPSSSEEVGPQSWVSAGQENPCFVAVSWASCLGGPEAICLFCFVVSNWDFTYTPATSYLFIISWINVKDQIVQFCFILLQLGNSNTFLQAVQEGCKTFNG